MLCRGQEIARLILFQAVTAELALKRKLSFFGFQVDATVIQAVEQSGGHLGVTKDCGPFAEA